MTGFRQAQTETYPPGDAARLLLLEKLGFWRWWEEHAPRRSVDAVPG